MGYAKITMCKKGHEWGPPSVQCPECIKIRQKAKGSDYNKKARQKVKNEGRLHEYDKHYALRSKFGLNLADYNQMVASQNGACGICGITGYTLHVDHDHESGQVRGLLCNNCNNGLGRFKDKVENLIRAQEYLQKYGK